MQPTDSGTEGILGCGLTPTCIDSAGEGKSGVESVS